MIFLFPMTTLHVSLDLELVILVVMLAMTSSGAYLPDLGSSFQTLTPIDTLQRGIFLDLTRR